MERAREIKQSMQEIFGVTPNLPVTATVVSIQDDNTCTVRLINDLEVSDVRLKSTFSDSKDGLLIVPKEGSKVMVLSQTGGLSNLIIIKVDQVDKIQYIKGSFSAIIDGAENNVDIKTGDLNLIIDGTSNKVTLKNGDVNFASLIDTLIQTITTLIITTPTGPGSINPQSQQSLTQLKGEFQKILNSN